ncbi:hypothetical protein BY457_111100 [Marinilabilia salmonicolor]|jgi:hypothetical protein|uniref:hypothetical protein n=1 Tax=Marinilabilia salmonicolor TaxID=989 RepID=UPI000D05B2AC|nr:hypothetical protein [Marinilabilia salmonicolor]PRY97819.1 hypothetical protein BY457_111100 [Marinilabilia salmonicolor]
MHYRGKIVITLFSFFLLFFSSCQSPMETNKIDRFALVNRHNIVVEEFDPMTPLSAGNGNFAFTADVTGLQTFYKEYEKGIPLGTMSNWGWHTIPNKKYDSADFPHHVQSLPHFRSIANAPEYQRKETYRSHEVEGREVPYEDQIESSPRAMEAADYFRSNPHRLHLGIIRLKIIKSNGEEIVIEDVKSPEQKLDLWRGELYSEFEVEGQPITVKLFVHQEKDLISARIESPLIESQQLSVEWLFPYGAPVHTGPGYDFGSPNKHHSILQVNEDGHAAIRRILDEDEYFTDIRWKGGAVFEKTEAHCFLLTPNPDQQALEFSCLFSASDEDIDVPGFAETEKNNEKEWEKFWTTGGAVDFSKCTDPRARELERRTVLSQYLTKINGSGNLPPQETGLVFNSWFGKFHLEMIWWHSAHYYNWQRTDYVEDQLEFYSDIYRTAVDFTNLQGYKGVRWPKMTGPDGFNSPSSIGSYLVWQQPHFIYLAEQQYQANPTEETLNKYDYLVFATADFMADFAVYDEVSDTYHLKPPLIPAQEHWDRETTENPPFELAYWHWGLSIAQKWKERLQEEPDEKWEEVRTKLKAPVSMDSVYLGIGNAPDSYSEPENMRDHPMVLGTYGMLPLWEKVDTAIMRNTLDLIMKNWNWEHTWGWDYPMVAMCAARLNEPEIALEALLMNVQKNTYLKNGHNYQDDRLKVYLPGNGGFLKTIALMCAGWEGCEIKNPGFPDDGTWDVEWENLNPDF